MKKIHFKEILAVLDCEFKVEGDGSNILISNVKPPNEADHNTMIWIDPKRNDKSQILQNSKAKVIVCDDSLLLSEEDKTTKVLIQVENPKLVFIDIVKYFFTEKQQYTIHPSAIINPDAKIAPEVFIGPLTYIGRAEIGTGSILHGSTHICDGVRIGENVEIQAGCVIGSEGLNITKDIDGVWHQFPHIGGVVIEDNVRIDAMCHIDRGTLSDTVIGEGTKLDKACYIAHNAKIGKNNIIIGHTMISGSVVVGNNCWFGPNTVVRDGIKIGNNVFLGMGSLVVSDLEDNINVMGSPARPVNEMKKLLNIFKRGIDGEE